jgi:hypothetical protein
LVVETWTNGPVYQIKKKAPVVLFYAGELLLESTPRNRIMDLLQINKTSLFHWQAPVTFPFDAIQIPINA